MYSGIIGGFGAAFLLLAIGISEKIGAQTQDLKLDLEKFPDTSSEAAAGEKSKELELNLEQFDKTDEQKSSDLELNLDQFDKKQPVEKNSNTELELNLDQFEGNSDSSILSNSDSQQSDTGNVSPKYNYRHIFIISGLVFLVFLYYLSRRRKRRLQR